MQGMGPGMAGLGPALDLGAGTRDPNSPSKKEQFRILALNVAMGIENGRVEAVKANVGPRVIGPGDDSFIGHTAAILKDAEAIMKFIDSGH